MFTGLVEKTGVIRKLGRHSGGWRLEVACELWPDDPVVLGESIAVQGVCLTVAALDANGFTADLLDETLRRSALGRLGQGSRINLERAMKLGDRLGGHIVSGHVDETGVLVSIREAGRDFELTIACTQSFARQCVMKGSVALDGVSLTITGLTDDSLSVNIIPHTWKATSLGERKKGDLINLESDVIGKYVARYMDVKPGGLTEDSLRKAGFCVS